MNTPYIILAVVVIILLWIITTYNGLIIRRNRTKEAWADIDVQLKRRYDLIPNLVETVKGYAAHERELFEKVTAFQQKKYIKNLKFGATANVFTLRSVIDKVGFLDGTLKSGADLEWGQRIAAAGYRQIYAEDVCVSHPARNSIRQVYRKNIRVINGLNDMKKKKDSLKKFLIDLKDDWPQLDDFGDIFSNEKLSNLSQKIKVFLVMLFVKEVRAFERIKLYFGQKSKRIKIL